MRSMTGDNLYLGLQRRYYNVSMWVNFNRKLGRKIATSKLKVSKSWDQWTTL
jgi:hypothetical protein